MPPSDNPLAPLFQAWLDVAMPHWQGPVLGKVEKAQSDAQGYVCSVSLLDVGTLEETGEQLEGVVINALWAGANGAGIFALPAVGRFIFHSQYFSFSGRSYKLLLEPRHCRELSV